MNNCHERGNVRCKVGNEGKAGLGGGGGGGGGQLDYAILPSPSVGSHYYAGYKEQRKSHSPT